MSADPYLVDCARTALRCRDFAAQHHAADPRFALLLQRLAAVSGYTQHACEQYIERLAQGIDDSADGDPRPINPFHQAWQAFRREFQDGGFTK
jgi:hypothetical protein